MNGHAISRCRNIRRAPGLRRLRRFARGSAGQRPKSLPPSQVVDFNLLYRQNCAGCHGVDGKGGAAIALANPVFLAIADDAVIRRTATNGVPGTPMPAFAQSAGGMLTDKQIDALVQGIRAWAKPDALRRSNSSALCSTGSGRSATWRRCVSNILLLLSWSGRPRGNKASSIVDGSYLALVSDQQLRTDRDSRAGPSWVRRTGAATSRVTPCRHKKFLMSWHGFPANDHNFRASRTRFLREWTGPTEDLDECGKRNFQAGGSGEVWVCFLTASSAFSWRCRSYAISFRL